MGVKSLWTLLGPVGRPVMLETTEGKAMAIDSSIWIYQFQATMRDKEGRALVNAHVLGFLRRISKLLFYGIKPVFVFDGGAPALKRNTLNERRKKKSGAAASHHKIAEKLLAAQLRREALNHVQKGSNAKAKPNRQPDLNDNTVYLEDIDGSAPRTPAKRRVPPPSSTSAKKRVDHHDPYNLPDVNMEANISKATRSVAPDPRLATEEELRTFIEDMRPEDFDINSPAFRELPTEVQYEIIGDLRLKSRQTSYARLHKMLKSARTPMDFSKQQIMNLRQRNSLTQQLLMTTDTIGNAHIAIPVRIASERNKEYILMKNEGEDGGWILGIKDIGTTREKPIVLDHEETKVAADSGDDSDADMEEVEVPTSVMPDPDLREYQREMALSGIAARNTSTGLRSLTSRPINRKTKSAAFYEILASENTSSAPQQLDPDDDDDLIAYAIQASLDQSSLPGIRPNSTPEKPKPATPQSAPKASTSKDISSDDDFYEDYSPPIGLQSALSMANAGPSNSRNSSTPSKSRILFGRPSLLSTPSKTSLADQVASESSDDMEEVISAPRPVQFEAPSILGEFSASTVSPENTSLDPATASTIKETSPAIFSLSSTLLQQSEKLTKSTSKPKINVSAESESDEEMEEIPVAVMKTQDMTLAVPQHSDKTRSPALSDNPEQESPEAPKTLDDFNDAQSTFSLTGALLQQPPKPEEENISSQVSAGSESDEDMEEITVVEDVHDIPSQPMEQPIRTPSPDNSDRIQTGEIMTSETSETLHTSQNPSRPSPMILPSPPRAFEEESMEEPLFAWSRTPSPTQENFPLPETIEEWDAAQEMDPHAEEGEFARFMSQMKGKNVDDVRKEIDEEIKVLNQQRKAAMRDSEDITQQMIAQIMTMLRLFGIPYITAPMEAEAQCAELVSLGLVDGVITDDSDVFLFGAQRVYKNMFNQSKTVECFLSTDLSRELGLDRDTLVQLAYLLGSDYTEGLLGIGPVVAMELLKEFPGFDGLFKFKAWWSRVQSGKDKEEESSSKFRKQFKKKFKSLYLASDWPNSIVRDAYYHPTVDSSEEPFKWGMPDLDGLRHFFESELSWHQSKVDELLLPIIQRMNKRNQVAALNKQGTLNDYLDLSAGNGSYAPRQRQAYASKRLQQVISDFRKSRKNGSVRPQSPAASTNVEQEQNSDYEEATATKKRKRSETPASEGSKGKGKAKAKVSTSRPARAARGAAGGAKARGRGRGGKSRAGKGKAREFSESDEDTGSPSERDDFTPPQNDEVVMHREIELNLRPRPKPRPRYKPQVNPGEETPSQAMDGQGSLPPDATPSTI
ncbi:PIN domain-like protein [Pholiota conissans]|uniref:PIN domain-like protein n=1 Tax=Pholiota conissans TaxID=109636 RepID=A0A9P6D632_9AGAR|nr:PIN domain-like protein [Pholiota conissans]